MPSPNPARIPLRSAPYADDMRQRVLLLAVDAGLAAAVFLLPMVMGGRQALGHLVLVAIACGVTLLWSLLQFTTARPTWRFSGAEPLLVLAVLVGILQIVSLPPDVVQRISPEISRMLPLWQEDASGEPVFGLWTTVSLVPAETAGSLIAIVACMLVFFVTLQRMREVADAQRILTWVAASATLMAAFGLLQFFAGNGKFFWVYDHPFTDTLTFAKGAFTNPNHFCDFLGMSVPILIWKIAATQTPATSGRRSHGGWSSAQAGIELRRRRVTQGLSAAALAIVGLAILLSQSRGGMLATGGASLLSCILLWRQRVLSGRFALGILGAAGMAAMFLATFGDRLQAVVERNLEEIVSVDVESLDHNEARRRVWSAVLTGARDFPILGTGVSSHREVYWHYLDAPDIDKEYSHAENGYLQILLETGVTGLAIAAFLILMVFFWCFRGMQLAQSADIGAPLAAVTGTLAVNVIHSLADFVWYVPGCMTIVMMIAAVAARLFQLSRPLAAPQRAEASEGILTPARLAWGVAFIAALAGGQWMLRVKLPEVAAEPHWFEYIRLVNADPARPDDVDDATQSQELFRRKLVALLSAVKADPQAHRAQLRAVSAYLALFERSQQQGENPMSLAQIADAARSAGFASMEEMNAWLNLPGVIGDNRKYLDAARAKAHAALQLCPLQSQGYILLADLNWLEDSGDDGRRRLLDQALTVRPHDARAHFAVGRELWSAGRHEAAVDHWKEAFQRSDGVRDQLISALSSSVPASFFLSNFEPDAEALEQLRAAYATAPDQDGYHNILEQVASIHISAAEQLSGGRAAAELLAAHRCYVDLGDDARALQAATAAVHANPHSFDARMLLGQWSYDRGDYGRAAEHLLWCYRRRPADGPLETLAKKAVREAERSKTQVATEPDGGPAIR